MAKASVRNIPVIVTKRVRDGVTLELSTAEANALALVFAKVGGAGDTTARGHVQAVCDALRKVGICWRTLSPNGLDGLFDKDGSTGSLYFTAASLAIVEGK